MVAKVSGKKEPSKVLKKKGFSKKKKHNKKSKYKDEKTLIREEGKEAAHNAKPTLEEQLKQKGIKLWISKKEEVERGARKELIPTASGKGIALSIPDTITKELIPNANGQGIVGETKSQTKIRTSAKRQQTLHYRRKNAPTLGIRGPINGVFFKKSPKPFRNLDWFGSKQQQSMQQVGDAMLGPPQEVHGPGFENLQAIQRHAVEEGVQNYQDNTPNMDAMTRVSLQGPRLLKGLSDNLVNNVVSNQFDYHYNPSQPARLVKGFESDRIHPDPPAELSPPPESIAGNPGGMIKGFAPKAQIHQSPPTEFLPHQEELSGPNQMVKGFNNQEPTPRESEPQPQGAGNPSQLQDMVREQNERYSVQQQDEAPQQQQQQQQQPNSFVGEPNREQSNSFANEPVRGESGEPGQGEGNKVQMESLPVNEPNPNTEEEREARIHNQETEQPANPENNENSSPQDNNEEMSAGEAAPPPEGKGTRDGPSSINENAEDLANHLRPPNEFLDKPTPAFEPKDVNEGYANPDAPKRFPSDDRTSSAPPKAMSDLSDHALDGDPEEETQEQNGPSNGGVSKDDIHEPSQDEAFDNQPSFGTKPSAPSQPVDPNLIGPPLFNQGDPAPLMEKNPNIHGRNTAMGDAPQTPPISLSMAQQSDGSISFPSPYHNNGPDLALPNRMAAGFPFNNNNKADFMKDETLAQKGTVMNQGDENVQGYKGDTPFPAVNNLPLPKPALPQADSAPPDSSVLPQPDPTVQFNEDDPRNNKLLDNAQDDQLSPNQHVDFLQRNEGHDVLPIIGAPFQRPNLQGGSQRGEVAEVASRQSLEATPLSGVYSPLGNSIEDVPSDTLKYNAHMVSAVALADDTQVLGMNAMARGKIGKMIRKKGHHHKNVTQASPGKSSGSIANINSTKIAGNGKINGKRKRNNTEIKSTSTKLSLYKDGPVNVVSAGPAALLRSRPAKSANAASKQNVPNGVRFDKSVNALARGIRKKLEKTNDYVGDGHSSNTTIAVTNQSETNEEVNVKNITHINDSISALATKNNLVVAQNIPASKPLSRNVLLKPEKRPQLAGTLPRTTLSNPMHSFKAMVRSIKDKLVSSSPSLPSFEQIGKNIRSNFTEASPS